MIDLKTLVNDDNEIYVSKSYWKELNEKYSKDEIKQALSDAIEEFQVPLPYKKITEEDALEDYNKLINLDAISLLNKGNVVTRYDYKYQLSDWYIDASNVGLKSSDYFHQSARWKADSTNAPSPYRTWTTERFRLTLFNALWTLKFEEINTHNLKTAIALRKYIAGQFRPAAAKAMYNLFDAKIILDPSAGWGDRLSGFLAYRTEQDKIDKLGWYDEIAYIGTDPNRSIDYDRQVNFLDKKAEGYVKVEHRPFENISHYEEFDFIFTSPPYFNIEKYSKDPEQSYLKYRKFDDWLNWFLNEYVSNMWKSLDNGGHLAINISDVYSGHRINNICDPMNDFLTELGGTYLGTIGLRMPKRPNSKAIKDGIFVEPIWIWKKEPNGSNQDNGQELEQLIANAITKKL